MTTAASFFPTTWILKFCEYLLAAIAIADVLMFPLELVPRPFGEANKAVGETVLPLVSQIVPLLVDLKKTQSRFPEFGGAAATRQHRW